MTLPNIQTIKADAARAYRLAREPKKVVLAYSGFTILAAVLLTLVSNYLIDQIEGTGGLSNFGIRSILSTAQSVLPILQAVVLMGLEFGYLHAVLRMSRGQYADHTDLKTGFQRLGPILRLNLLQGFRFLGLGFLAFYASMMLYMATPLSEPVAEILMPLVTEASTSADVMALMDEATLAAATEAMLPLFLIFGILYSLLAIPMYYRLRFSVYVLLDDPSGSAMLAMRKSTQLLRGNKLRLLKLDLSFWWFYLLNLLAPVVSYGDVILPMLGIRLPFSETFGYYLFYGLYLAMLFCIYYFLRNPVEMAYAKAYDFIAEKPKDNGVVLGSIFD